MATNNTAEKTEDSLTRIFAVCDRNRTVKVETRKQKEDAKLATLRARGRQPWYTREQE